MIGASGLGAPKIAMVVLGSVWSKGLADAWRQPKSSRRSSQIEKHGKDQVAEIKKATADTERIDLRNLLDLVKAIAVNEKLIEDLDKEVGAGAAPCSVGADDDAEPHQLPRRKPVQLSKPTGVSSHGR